MSSLCCISRSNVVRVALLLLFIYIFPYRFFLPYFLFFGYYYKVLLKTCQQYELSIWFFFFYYNTECFAGLVCSRITLYMPLRGNLLATTRFVMSLLHVHVTISLHTTPQLIYITTSYTRIKITLLS